LAALGRIQYGGIKVTVLVTGASGFIGRHAIGELLRRSIKVRVACRQGTEVELRVDNVEVVYLSGPGIAAADWADAVAHCSAVIHLAARAHVLRDRYEDPVRAFRLANVDYARACGEAAVIAGVQRFIFMSSVGVHGGTSGAQPIQAESSIRPHTQYACSKAEAEQALFEVVRGSGMTLTVVRPPLVYGPGAPGNFGVLVRAIASGLPLPFGSITHNRRSLVAIDNLVDLIVTCLTHPAAANQTFLVSDKEDISTAELLQRLGSMKGKSARLMTVPVAWLAFGAKLLGKREMFQSLYGSLQVDISKTCTLLDWKPPVSLDEGLRRAVQQRL
jgi:nucleoside-diphosphate-sugar epimerase